MTYSINDYDFELDESLIAQDPADKRDASKLMRLDRENGGTSVHLFSDIKGFLRENDVLVVNNTQVIPGRLYGRKETGGKVEVLIIDYAQVKLKGSLDELEFECLIRASKGPKPGSNLSFDEGLSAVVVSVGNGTYRLRFQYNVPGRSFDDVLAATGRMPLPPYIRRSDTEADRESYQTVYAKEKGAVAAPTAGIHFTTGLLDEIRAKGVKIVEITLHIGYGTFLPVRVDDIRNHEMHRELFSISEQAAQTINQAKEAGSRLVAVGTTSIRTLEFAADESGMVKPGSGECGLFIYPGYKFKAVDAVITNFHLPKSTLIMLVSAFAGRDNVLAAYRDAMEHDFRFFSYGDGMFIE